MTIKQLRAFVAVAETLSFAEACSRVHLSQPALSLAIKSLEESVGGRLFSRTTRSLALTPDGEAFLPVAQRLVADWDDAQEDLHNRFKLRRGKVAIAAMPSFAANLLPQALLNFRQRHANINMEVHDVIAEQVVEMVSKGRVELGISFDPGPQEDLNFITLFDDEFIAVLPDGHELQHCDVIEGEQLFSYDFITLQRPSSVRLLIERRASEMGLMPKTAFDTHQLATVGRMVATGLGVSAVPALCRQQMEEIGAICRPLRNPVISRRVGILSRRRSGLSVAAEAMQQVLIDTYRQTLQ
ncbi:LysR family transcriptional regulator [Pokkaliibacter plantistimulans]|uniref:LysR family transcriptional regulator n=1 Tax=Proteobacteria bacterium 228 TaxID=2083153 RepID=A0A2S5KND3_9PROT|nr:LysR family transcriptional regulator [Pokkaliibacter plantistimulans]PPC76039.1 LysR family transcriptional regulator [Pokkaliibacter plantistimulans]